MARTIRVAAIAATLSFLTSTAAAQVFVPPGAPPPPPPPPPTAVGGTPGAMAEGTGLILGRVIDAATGRPIAGVVVTVSSGVRRVLTDGEGQFVFDRLPKGTFSINASKTGYAEAAYGRLRPGGAGIQLELEEGARRGDVDILMWKFAVITGTVVDEAGDPVTGVSVRAYRRALSGGRRRFQTAGGPMTSHGTDDRGVYRIFGLLPGEYVVGIESTTVAVPIDVADAYRTGMEGNDPARQAMSREMASIRGFPGGPRIDGMALSNMSGSLMPTTVRGRLFTYPTTFYPAAAAAAQASVITIGSGEERSAIDFQLKPVPTVRVSGLVTGPEGPVSHAAVRLIPAASEVLSTEIETSNTMTDASGAFRFLGVTPGQYTLRVARMPPAPPPMLAGTSTIIETGSGRMSMSISGEPNAPPPPLPAGDTWWANVPVSVGASDLADVAVSLRTGARITGRVEFEGAAAATLKPDVIQRVAIFLTSGSNERMVVGMLRGRVEGDGRFSTASIPGGLYTLRAAGPAGWTFKSAIHEGRDLADQPIDVTSDISGVVVTFTDTPSELSGTIAADGRAIDATVLLFPTEPSAWTDWGVSSRRLRAIRPQPNGTFRMASLPEGDYYVIAVSDESAVDWQDQKALETLSRSATTIRIEDGQKKSVQLRVTNVARRP